MMREHDRKVLVGALKALIKVHDELPKMDSAARAKTLEECQNAAMQVGEAAERSEGEGTAAVKHLEEYCEMLYMLSQETDEFSIRKKARMLDRTINDAILELLELKTHRLVYFLPYKASMWDCLASVWRAAASDDGCEAVVMPIPYFDRDTDGGIKKWHYEGNDYPADVHVTDYRTVDLEKLHPDIIFVHNPYDSFNKVTSIAPEFYCSRIKHYTDMLVYIPYYVDGDDINEDLCVSQGLIHADRVIVNDEREKQAYMLNIKNFERMNHLQGFSADMEKKLMPLGNPKYDSIVLACDKREEYERTMPEEWKKHIFDSTGTRRRVILYNTSVAYFLRYQEKDLQKIKKVLEQIRDNQNTVLLWRPHPLLRATIAAMKPELAAVYDDLVNSYRSEDFGIYDDTPDMERAVAISDAYYGDAGSSVETLYKVTGKPIMEQVVE